MKLMLSADDVKAAILQYANSAMGEGVPFFTEVDTGYYSFRDVVVFTPEPTETTTQEVTA